MTFQLNSFIETPMQVFKIVDNFNRDLFSIKDCKLSYRTLNHYQEIGIITAKKGSGWRKFSGTELVWIGIIVQLREMGISLDKILKIKDFLFSESFAGSVDRSEVINNSIEQEIAHSVFNNYSLYLIVFSDFKCAFYDSYMIKQWHLKPYKDEPHLSIPLRTIIKEVEDKILVAI